MSMYTQGELKILKMHIADLQAQLADLQAENVRLRDKLNPPYAAQSAKRQPITMQVTKLVRQYKVLIADKSHTVYFDGFVDNVIYKQRRDAELTNP